MNKQELEQLNLEIATVAALVEEIGEICCSDANIHDHTAAFGDKYRYLRSIANEYQLYTIPDSETIDSVIEKIRTLVPEGRKDAVDKALGTITANQQEIEGETKTNVVELLIHTWSTTENNLEKGVIIDCLAHNFEADGGCLAGIAARLIQPYAKNVLNFAEVKYELGKYALGTQEDTSMVSAVTTDSAKNSNNSQHQNPNGAPVLFSSPPTSPEAEDKMLIIAKERSERSAQEEKDFEEALKRSRHDTGGSP